MKAVLFVVPIVFGILAGACAEVQRIPGPVVYRSSEVQQVSFSPAAATAQSLKVMVRANGAGLEARLSEAPLCERTVSERLDGVQITHQKLTKTEEIAKWSYWSVAGLSAGFVGAGMIRGRDPVRGTLLIGLYGVPFAGLGAWQTWRSRDLEDPVKPIQVTRPGGRATCPKGKDLLSVDLYYTAEAMAPANLSPEWQPVKVPVSDPKTFQRGLVLPLAMIGKRWVVYLPAQSRPAGQE